MKNKNSDTNATNYIRMPRILFGSVLIVITFALAIPTFAQTEYNLIEPLPGIQSVKDFPDFISRFIPFLLAFAALAAFVQIVFGGILRATSGGNPTAIGDANDRIWMAIGGLVLALSAYLILNTINPDLVSLRFLVPKVEIAPTQLEEQRKENLCKTKCKPEEQCQVQQNNKVVCIPLPPIGP